MAAAAALGVNRTQTHEIANCLSRISRLSVTAVEQFGDADLEDHDFTKSLRRFGCDLTVFALPAMWAFYFAKCSTEEGTHVAIEHRARHRVGRE
jgi:hypothetical protein